MDLGGGQLLEETDKPSKLRTALPVPRLVHGMTQGQDSEKSYCGSKFSSC